jgi:imidazolonepropionase-like amidohydrolase
MKTSAYLFYLLLFVDVTCFNNLSSSQTVKIIKGVTLIDCTGKDAVKNASIFIKEGVIEGIALLPPNAKYPKDAEEIDYSGKFVMPAMINGHCHLGLLKGDKSSPDNYNRENILRHLAKYQQYGIGKVLCLGTDQEMIFPMRDSSQKNLLPGATIYTAGFGITAPGNSPPANLSHSIMQPQTVDEAIKDVDRLATFKPDFVKIWVDDFNGAAKKMQPEIYEAIIKEAHTKGLRVAAHLYYLDDAKRLVNAGIDVIAHSIRDKDVDEELITAMKQKGVYYIPTLSLDDYNVVYADNPGWLNDSFFKASLEPGVWERLTSASFKQQMLNDSTFPKKKAAFETAMRNLKKLSDAGVVIVLGSDSGAQPVRTQGFSEHLELQLMVEAGLTPMQAIIAATNNGAKMLHINNQYGTLQKGMKADFIVLNSNPLEDIKQTRSIVAVWKEGMKVSDGVVQ